MSLELIIVVHCYSEKVLMIVIVPLRALLLILNVIIYFIVKINVKCTVKNIYIYKLNIIFP